MKQQKGFTLVELVVVIVILGILAATALPRFVDLSVDARNSSAQGVAGALASGTAINSAACQARGIAGAPGNGCVPLNVANVCTAALQPFVNGVTLQLAAPANDQQFQIGGAGDCTAATGNVTVTCTVTPNGAGVTPANAVVSCAR